MIDQVKAKKVEKLANLLGIGKEDILDLALDYLLEIFQESSALEN